MCPLPTSPPTRTTHTVQTDPVVPSLPAASAAPALLTVAPPVHDEPAPRRQLPRRPLTGAAAPGPEPALSAADDGPHTASPTAAAASGQAAVPATTRLLKEAL